MISAGPRYGVRTLEMPVTIFNLGNGHRENDRDERSRWHRRAADQNVGGVVATQCDSRRVTSVSTLDTAFLTT